MNTWLAMVNTVPMLLIALAALLIACLGKAVHDLCPLDAIDESTDGTKALLTEHPFSEASPPGTEGSRPPFAF